MVTLLPDPVITAKFPRAHQDGYLLTSPPTSDYNCIAWAADVDYINWWPLSRKKPGWHWPDGVDFQVTLENFLMAFATIGYVDAGMNGDLEEGMEKVAFYGFRSNGISQPTHAAWQLPDGSWASKLGPYRDIVHTTPYALVSTPTKITDYGFVLGFASRARRLRKCPIPQL